MLYSVVREIGKINERELELGGGASWHDDYKGKHSDSHWILLSTETD